MSATIVEEDLNELEAFEAEQQQEEAKPVAESLEEAIPEKYRGKSAAEIAKIALEQERFIGKQAQEVGEIRKLADQLILEKLNTQKPKEVGNSQPTDDELTDVDFFADPVKAVNKAVEKHPAVLAAKQAAISVKQKESLDRLTSTHPDYREVVQDPEFQNWVGQSRIRQSMFHAANREYNVEAADELLSTFKQLKARKAEIVQEGAQALKENTEKALKAVSVPSSGGTGETSKKIYRRADLINLQIRDPERYMQLQDEIMAAYASGRVK